MPEYMQGRPAEGCPGLAWKPWWQGPPMVDQLHHRAGHSGTCCCSMAPLPRIDRPLMGHACLPADTHQLQEAPCMATASGLVARIVCQARLGLCHPQVCFIPASPSSYTQAALA